MVDEDLTAHFQVVMSSIADMALGYLQYHLQRWTPNDHPNLNIDVIIHIERAICRYVVLGWLFSKPPGVPWKKIAPCLLKVIFWDRKDRVNCVWTVDRPMSMEGGGRSGGVVAVHPNYCIPQ